MSDEPFCKTRLTTLPYLEQPSVPPANPPDRWSARSEMTTLCRVADCGNEARYYAMPSSVHPTLCGLHDIEFNGGRGERLLDRAGRGPFDRLPVPCHEFTGPSGRCSTCHRPAVEHAGSVPHPKDRGCTVFSGTGDECAYCCLPFKWHANGEGWSL